MVRDSFVFYRSWYESVKALEEQEDVFCEVMRTILEYGLYGKTPRKLSPMATAFFTMIKPQIDANTKRYLNGLKGKEFGKLGAEFGKLGGRPKKNTEDPKNDINYKSIDYQQDNCKKITPQDIKNNPPNNPPNVYVNDNVNDNVNGNVNVNDNVKLPQSKIAIKTKEERKKEFKLYLLDKKFGYAEKYGTDMLADFYNYWTESNPNGKKMRWEMQKVFDVSRRLATWAKNCKNKSNFNYNYENEQRKPFDESNLRAVVAAGFAMHEADSNKSR